MDGVVDWLLQGDPAIRWQTLRDLTGTSPAQVSKERSLVATEGWGKRLLALQSEDGQWGGGPYSPKWISTTYTLLLLRHLGVNPASPAVAAAIDKVRSGVTMGSSPFFQYRREMCVTAMTFALSTYFHGEKDPGLYQLDYLLAGQREDGGWNCDNTSNRSSFHTTISVLEAFLEYERSLDQPSPALIEARSRGHEFLLERHLFRYATTGEVINPRWRLFSFPPRWHYDVLRALDYLRDAEAPYDERTTEAFCLVAAKRDANGRWPLQNRHPGKEHFTIEVAGQPSRWNTLRALRVLKSFGMDSNFSVE